jgi:AmpE protein
MKLIVILICVAALRYWKVGRTTKRYSWFAQYARKLQKVTGSWGASWIQFFVILLPILLLSLLLQFGLAHGVFYILGFLFSIIVLWYCLWPVSLRVYLESKLKSASAVNEPVMSDDSADGKGVDDEKAMVDPKAIIESLFCFANTQTFSVIFWFIILGPFGAILYRLVAEITFLASKPDSELGGLASVGHLLEDILEWLPARLVGLSYVIAGNFVHGFQNWLRNAKGGLSSNQSLLIESGMGAMDFSDDKALDVEDARQVVQLIDRSFIVWLVMLAIFTLGFWMY